MQRKKDGKGLKRRRKFKRKNNREHWKSKVTEGSKLMQRSGKVSSSVCSAVARRRTDGSAVLTLKETFSWKTCDWAIRAASAPTKPVYCVAHTFSLFTSCRLVTTMTATKRSEECHTTERSKEQATYSIYRTTQPK